MFFPNVRATDAIGRKRGYSYAEAVALSERSKADCIVIKLPLYLLFQKFELGIFCAKRGALFHELHNHLSVELQKECRNKVICSAKTTNPALPSHCTIAAHPYTCTGLGRLTHFLPEIVVSY